jgi:hypothetical protein
MSCVNTDREGSAFILSSFKSLSRMTQIRLEMRHHEGDVPCINACILSLNSDGSLGRLRLDDLAKRSKLIRYRLHLANRRT